MLKRPDAASLSGRGQAYLQVGHDEIFTLVVQVNGKVRERFEVPASISENEVRKLALYNPRVASFIGDATVQKVIYIPGRLVNIVVRNG